MHCRVIVRVQIGGAGGTASALLAGISICCSMHVEGKELGKGCVRCMACCALTLLEHAGKTGTACRQHHLVHSQLAAIRRHDRDVRE